MSAHEHQITAVDDDYHCDTGSKNTEYLDLNFTMMSHEHRGVSSHQQLDCVFVGI